MKKLPATRFCGPQDELSRSATVPGRSNVGGPASVGVIDRNRRVGTCCDRGRSHSVVALLAAAMLAAGAAARANPNGATVSQGQAAVIARGANTTITTSDRAFINWRSFNIGAGESTTFVQPSSSSVVWNRINDVNPSQILGTLNANGLVVLQNQSGFFIGGQASINTHGLLLTTSPIPMPDLSSSGPWSFNAPPPESKIINYGQINLDKGGSVFLIAHDIENHGAISAPAGNVGLYAGKEVLVSERPNGLGLSAKVTLPEGSVDNSGKLIADAGTIAVHAQVVNQGGLVQANSIREVNGVIELVASDAVNLGAGSVISAQGDGRGISPGGSVVVKSGSTFSDQATSVVNVSGGAQGGDGGHLEISAAELPVIHSSLNGRAAAGFKGGALTIDPTLITLDAVTEAGYNDQIINGGFSQFSVAADYITLVNGWATPASLTRLDLNANLDLTISSGWTTASTLSELNLTAGGNIFLNNNSVLFLAPPTLVPAATMTMTAGNSITLGGLDTLFNSGSISAGSKWNVNLNAGGAFVPTLLQPKPDSGSYGIFLINDSFITAGSGQLNLWAANEVRVGWGGVGDSSHGAARITTTGGGGITATTKYGDIETGQNNQGYVYRTTTALPNAPFYYSVSGALGGISTAAGGNVTLNAAGDVLSYLPGGTTITDAGTGAFGPQPGNVSISAGGNVYGHYVLANGVGTIMAGGDIGSPLRNVALSLVKGTWNLNAGGDIHLQEVRNPNGMFNANLRPRGGSHLFDYDPRAEVDLTAGNGVYLTGAGVPRSSSEPVPLIFPPSLKLAAGAGGVNLLTTLSLFPSAYGDLTITTTAGGSLVSDGAAVLIMSDSSKKNWSTADPGAFGSEDHGVPPALANPNPNPVEVSIDGNIENFTLLTTKETHINVKGDMKDSSFSGQNLSGTDKTTINVGGAITYRSLFSFVYLNQSPVALTYDILTPRWAAIFYLALSPTVTPADLVVPANVTPAEAALALNHLFPGSLPNPGFIYDAATRRLGYAGQMSQAVFQIFTQPFLTVLVYNSAGLPVVEGGRLKTQQISWVAPAQIADLYNASQSAPVAGSVQTGLRIGGPGEFDVHAGSISLGNALGIYSCGVRDAEGGFNRYLDLGPLTQMGGATLYVTSDHDLDMLTSTIAALGGGNVNVTAGGAMNLGSQGLFDASTLRAGILPDPSKKQEGYGIMATGVDADVNVIAGGDINVQSSRIASYNGGDIHIKSLEGSVNAGTGGSAPSQAFFAYIDPVTGLGREFNETVFGSGIVAYTLAVPPATVPSAATPGNITIETPKGNIIASLGGIIQEALNGNVSSGPTVTLGAGSPGFIGNIDLGNSGVIGGTVNVTANGNISGLVISRQDSTINAGQNFSGTVLSGGTANLAAGGTASGTVIGIAGVNAAAGSGVSATILSQNVSVNGGQNNSTLGTSASPTANSSAASATANDNAQQQVAATTEEEDPLKKQNRPVLTRTVGRVTVIIPKS